LREKKKGKKSGKELPGFLGGKRILGGRKEEGVRGNK